MSFSKKEHKSVDYFFVLMSGIYGVIVYLLDVLVSIISESKGITEEAFVDAKIILFKGLLISLIFLVARVVVYKGLKAIAGLFCFALIIPTGVFLFQDKAEDLVKIQGFVIYLSVVFIICHYTLFKAKDKEHELLKG